ncbi:hypothetical protein FJZ53_01610 [Candidatus Woesearchaeota archaeon]|nr:hypothetical protein [Candidatus Woesearchaeota archaeon]
MDKRKATITLTEKLNGLGCISLVTDPAVKSYLLNNAKSVVLDLKKTGRVITHCLDAYYFDLHKFTSDTIDTINRDSLPYGIRDYTNANYFFIEKNPDSSGSRIFATPAAIIGEAEERVLRENFYKNVPETILQALEELQILNFIDAYSIYSSLKPDEAQALKLGIYRPFKKKDKIEIGDVIQGSKSGRYYLVDKIRSGGGIEGYRFQDATLKTPATGKEDDSLYGECGSDCIIPVKKRLSDTAFFSFVFDLPYEDQNLEANKSLFKELSDSDSCKILQKEYSQGKHFKEYFSGLSEERQKRIVETIKPLPSQNSFLNSWLFNQGFDVKMDYLELYKVNTGGFINYFKRSDKALQELIISDLFNYEHVNQEVIGFLERECSQLLREVSFKKETSKG